MDLKDSLLKVIEVKGWVFDSKFTDSALTWHHETVTPWVSKQSLTLQETFAEMNFLYFINGPARYNERLSKNPFKIFFNWIKEKKEKIWVIIIQYFTLRNSNVRY